MTPRVSMEHEAKLAAPVGLALPDPHKLFRDLEVSAPTAQHLDASYFDTLDLRLARAGVTLRYRSGETGLPWTLKLPEHTSGTTLARNEIVEDGEPTSVPDTLLDLVRAYVRREPVVAIARVQTTRQVTTVADRDHQPLLALLDDTVTVDVEPEVQGHDHRRTHSSFREIEIELQVDGSRATQLLNRAVDRLVASGFASAPPLPKLVRGLGPPARRPPEGAAPPASGSEITTAELIGLALARALTQLIRSDPAVRLGEEPEAVHRFRTAVRQIRSHLRTFRSVLDPAWVLRVQQEVAWLAGAIGPLRDADVLIDRLHRQIATLPVTDQQAAGPLLHLLEHQRQTARHVLLGALRSARYDALLDTLVLGARSPSAIVSSKPRSMAATRLHLVQEPWRQLAAQARRLDPDPADDALHRVRILAKRCRYAAEAFAPVAGRPANRFARAMAEVQTLLGAHHDAVVTEAWLRTAVVELASTRDVSVVGDPSFVPIDQAWSAAILSAGQLVLLQRSERATICSRWPGLWRAVSSRKLRSWI